MVQLQWTTRPLSRDWGARVVGRSRHERRHRGPCPRWQLRQSPAGTSALSAARSLLPCHSTSYLDIITNVASSEATPPLFAGPPAARQANGSRTCRWCSRHDRPGPALAWRRRARKRRPPAGARSLARRFALGGPSLLRLRYGPEGGLRLAFCLWLLRRCPSSASWMCIRRRRLPAQLSLCGLDG